jgi:hypothetical protein
MQACGKLTKYLMGLRGKRKPTYAHAKANWNLGRDEFDLELAGALRSLRLHLNCMGLTKSADLDLLDRSDLTALAH